MAKKRTKEEKESFIKRFFPYEVWMMREAHRLLRQGVPSDQVVANALIESFCVHARNLIEFLKDKDDCDFDPRMFTVEGYELNKRFVGDSVLPRINAQISHLSRNRTVLASEKIGLEERDKIFAAIEVEVERFRQSLATAHRFAWARPPICNEITSSMSSAPP